MKDIELPPLPDGEASSFGSYTVFDVETLQSYARAAVEADRAQRVPDGWLLIATDAYEAGFGKGEQAHKTGREVDNPWGDEPGRGAWAIGYAIGKERAALASTPAQPAQQEPSEAEMVCAEAYQVVGCLLSDLGLFETEAARKILDNLSEARMVHQDVLPWESATTHQEPPQPVERKPMTPEDVREGIANHIEDVFRAEKVWTVLQTAAYIRSIEINGRHHGIRE